VIKPRCGEVKELVQLHAATNVGTGVNTQGVWFPTKTCNQYIENIASSRKILLPCFNFTPFKFTFGGKI
jgi:hypothetical protein